MPTPTIPAGNLFMNATLYTGNGSTQTITNGPAGASFQPDFVWSKLRSGGNSHRLFDSVRGIEKVVYSNLTNAQATETGTLTSFTASGFNLGSNGECNTNGSTYVGWNWKAGGAAVTNNAGNRTSQVSANTTSGFSVVTYTFVTSGTNTVGHGLGVAPAMIIMKDLTTGYNWDVYHQSVGYTQRLILNDTSAATSGFWASAPTSTTFAVTSSMGSNNDAIVAYCFASIAGYSAFGSYTGNGSTDGPFIYTGFRPRFVMFKRTDAVEQWAIRDTSRDTYNASELELFPNLSNAEEDNNLGIDIVSNGFKIRNSSNRYNASGGTYIYACFAENPFKYANAR